MKNKNLIYSFFILFFSLLLTVSAQNKPQQKHPDNCTCQSCVEAHKAVSEHKCSGECKTDGCKTDACNHSEAEVTEAHESHAKHVCTEECKTKGCDFVKAKEARAALDLNKDGFIYECPMKCEPGKDKPGECSKCGMELEKVSVKS